ncbi:MAG: hypothetical protein Q8N23_13955 [Archangium sp.]|nr:hypothetical protein [Archangium sp.]MDP3153777.1 hypothetical protein [Archangium sp.]MDP3575664.1 hypothetical protein [Archangium sp.]
MKINRPATPAVTAQPKPQTTKPAAAAAEPARGWGPKPREVLSALVQLPFSEKISPGGPPGKPKNPRAVVAEAASAAAQQVTNKAQQLNDLTKPSTTNAAGRTPTTPYKYTGALEVGLETLNRTFEGGGVDLKKAAQFLEKNSKLPDNS